MTAAPVAATCTAQVTDPTNTWACTSHLGVYHVADTGDGGLRLWLDPDDGGFAPWEAPMIARIRSELGTPPAQRPDPVAVVLDRVADLAHRLRGRPSSIGEINAYDALGGTCYCAKFVDDDRLDEVIRGQHMEFVDDPGGGA